MYFHQNTSYHNTSYQSSHIKQPNHGEIMQNGAGQRQIPISTSPLQLSHSDWTHTHTLQEVM